MYKETLEILMEGINDPIKEQILKNQLEYHFKHKTKENKVAIDNSTTIVRRMLNDFEIMDLVEVQPIAPWNADCLTIHNDEKYEVETNTNGLYFHAVPTLRDEINEAIAAELNHKISRDLTHVMLKYATKADDIVMDKERLFDGEALVDSIVQRAEEVSAKWIIIGLCEMAIIRMSDRYTDNEAGFKLSAGVSLNGFIDGRFAVYISLEMNDNMIVGSSDAENPPIVYAPETLLVVGDYEKDSNRFQLATAAEIFVDLDAMDERYSNIDIIYQNNTKSPN